MRATSGWLATTAGRVSRAILSAGRRQDSKCLLHGVRRARSEGNREFCVTYFVDWQYMVWGTLDVRSHFPGPEICGARDGEKSRVQRDGDFNAGAGEGGDHRDLQRSLRRAFATTA